MDGSPHMLYRDFRMVSIRTGICLLDFWLLPVKMRVCGKRRSARSRQEYEFLFVLIWIDLPRWAWWGQVLLSLQHLVAWAWVFSCGVKRAIEEMIKSRIWIWEWSCVMGYHRHLSFIWFISSANYLNKSVFEWNLALTLNVKGLGLQLGS